MSRPRHQHAPHLALRPQDYTVMVQAAAVAQRRFHLWATPPEDLIYAYWQYVWWYVTEYATWERWGFGACLQFTRRMYLARQRQAQRRQVGRFLTPECDAASAGPDHTEVVAARDLLAAMEPYGRHVVWQRLWRGLTWREIGDLYGVTGAAVRARYHKALREAREASKGPGTFGLLLSSDKEPVHTPRAFPPRRRRGLLFPRSLHE